MYQKSMKVVIGSYFKFKELYPWPKHSPNISIKKVIGNGLENLKVESKWENLHVFDPFWSLNDFKCKKTCKGYDPHEIERCINS